MELKSIFTKDFEHCYISGRIPVAIHHVFGGSNRRISEKYGFIVPLHPDYHTGRFGVYNGNRNVDLQLKCACENWWLKQGYTKEQWIETFGKWWLLNEKKEPPKIF